MKTNTKIVMVLFGALLLMMIGGILVHQLADYPYPATKANNYEFNVLNDLYEGFVFIPVGLLGLLLVKRGSSGGAAIISGAAIWTVYNYAMMVTGKQNLWIFLWTAKLAVAGPLLLLSWNTLASKKGYSPKVGKWMAVYLAFTTVIFGKLMVSRLVASAQGKMVNMAMVGQAAADWADPALRDPIVFIVLVLPIFVAAIIGLLGRTEYGAKLMTLLSTFLIGMVSVIIFTGPVKEILMDGKVSSAMLGMSALMVAFVVPAIIWLWSDLRIAKR